ncbi:MAG: M48 family metalloprotease [Deltaproteobacteria bacterium]|nr:M48 family metalloprotease [Deltaproteobacteria bacterium]
MYKLISLILCLFFLGCATGRGINEGQLNMYSYDQEKAIGEQFAQMVGGQFEPLYDPQISAYVDKIGQKIVNVATDPLFDYQFRVLKHDMVNAFTVGAGYVFVTVGLMNAAPHEAGFASVVGHEIGHVLSRHVAERLTQANLLGLAASIAGGGAGQVIDLFGNVGLLQFGKANELEADRLGLQLIYRSRYNLDGAIDMFKVLKKLADDKGTSSLLGDLLATHPNTQLRIDKLKELIPQYKAKEKTTLNTESFKTIHNKVGQYLKEIQAKQKKTS